MNSRGLTHLAAVLFAALCVGPLMAPAALAQARDATVGPEGELYVIREGTYGELFPHRGLVDPENRVLALEIVRGEEPRQRLLVPGTETADRDDSASILLEDQSGTLFVLWQTMIRSIHSRLVLVGLRDGEWSDPIEISGSPFGWKSSPQLAVTRDTFRTVEEDGGLRRWTRTMVHILWWEEGPSGEPWTYYSPVTLLDGVYVGWNPVYRLDELAGTSTGVALANENLPLSRAPRIEPGRNAQSVVMGFVLSASRELTTASVEVLPGELSFIADAVRAQIVDLGRDSSSDEPTSLAGKVRAQIVDLGRELGLHPGLSSYLAESVAVTVEAASPSDPLSSLAERVRAQIVDLGARMTDRGLERASAAHRVEVIEGPSDSDGAPPNLIRLEQSSVRPAPRTGELDNTVFLSQKGREVVVSWVEDGAVFYRESRGQGWSEARPLRLGSELDLQRAREILERRADERSDE